MNLNQSYSSGGSVNSAQSSGWSQSGTNAIDARAWSEAQSALAWSRDMDALQMQMAFNAAEAQKQRDWEERMANTVYTRSVANMREAGINPILAANMGLSGAQVGSGATASIGGTPSAPLAQNFMDSWSASQNASESRGSSWQSSEGGLVTALQAFGGMIGSAIDKISSGMSLDINMSGLANIVDRILGSDPTSTERSFTKELENMADDLYQRLTRNYGNYTDGPQPTPRLSNGSVNAGSGRYSTPYGTNGGRPTQ